VSSTGHGSFRAASLAGLTSRGTVPAHLFAYQLAHGAIPRLGWYSTEDAVISHQWTSPDAPTPHPWAGHQRHQLHRIPHAAMESRQFTRRRARRSRAHTRHRSRHHAGLANQEDAASIELRIRNAEAEGLSLTLW
jgi:hypothetical protein